MPSGNHGIVHAISPSHLILEAYRGNNQCDKMKKQEDAWMRLAHDTVHGRDDNAATGSACSICASFCNLTLLHSFS